MTTKRVIFTGQSGIKIDKALNGFISTASPFVRGHQIPLFLKIEDEMKNIYLREYGKQDSPSIWIAEILTLAIPAVYDLWEKAFTAILEKIESEENKTKDIFINFHASFYHHYTVEYLSFVRVELIRRFQPNLFITLIDDIYDIHIRLRELHQIFHPSYGGATDPIGAILELLRILDWRSKEIMMTRHFANELNAPHYVFAVKHSYDTLYRLIFEEKSKFYISHPISEVRRLQKRGETEEANQIIDAIHRLESKSSSEFVSFLPTTIDELRIQQEEKDKKTVYVPNLMPRWDSEKYRTSINLLYIPPPKSKTPDPLWEKGSEYPVELTLLLKVLYNHIEVQVSSRDHKLVEQSDFLFVYRPCFNGNISDGVLKEIQYYLKLTGSSGNKKCFIYLPTKDQNKLKIRQLEEIIESKIKSGALKRNVEGPITLNSAEENKLINACSNINTIVEVLKEIMDNKGIYFHSERRGLESDKAQKAIEFITEIAKIYVSNFEQHIYTYKQAATVLWEDDDLLPETLVDKIVEHLTKNK